MLEIKGYGLCKGVGSCEGIESLEGFGVLPVRERGEDHPLRPSLVLHFHALESGESLGFLLVLELLPLPLPILLPTLDKVGGVSFGIRVEADRDGASGGLLPGGSGALRCPAHKCIQWQFKRSYKHLLQEVLRENPRTDTL